VLPRNPYRPTPKNIKDLQSFLGFVNYYRRFVKDHAKIAAPLTELLKKDKPWEWGTNQQGAFDALRTAMTQTPVLQLADASGPYVMATDASDYAMGAVLMQDFGKGYTTCGIYVQKTARNRAE
jgi:hypothetical protein